jgi:hypothetical protein
MGHKNTIRFNVAMKISLFMNVTQCISNIITDSEPIYNLGHNWLRLFSPYRTDSHIFMINSMLNHVALLKPPLPAPPSQCWACVMVYYQKSFPRCSQHWTGGRGRQSLFCQCSITL